MVIHTFPNTDTAEIEPMASTTSTTTMCADALLALVEVTSSADSLG